MGDKKCQYNNKNFYYYIGPETAPPYEKCEILNDLLTFRPDDLKNMKLSTNLTGVHEESTPPCTDCAREKIFSNWRKFSPLRARKTPLTSACKKSFCQFPRF